jgi:hypothetical protein
LRDAECAVLECRNGPFLQAVGARCQLRRRIAWIELNPPNIIRRITCAPAFGGPHFEGVVFIFCDGRFDFLAGTKLDGIRSTTERAGKKKTCDSAGA